jgi:hypothetical protein
MVFQIFQVYQIYLLLMHHCYRERDIGFPGYLSPN